MSGNILCLAQTAVRQEAPAPAIMWYIHSLIEVVTSVHHKLDVVALALYLKGTRSTGLHDGTCNSSNTNQQTHSNQLECKVALLIEGAHCLDKKFIVC
jgi:hypothetical protein